MNSRTKEIYSELYQVFDLLGNEYINKLPTSLLNMLREKRDSSYNPKYIIDIPLRKQNIHKETLGILALLYLNYWCENEKEKEILKQTLKNNEDNYQLELRIKYNPEDIFKNNNQKNVIENQSGMIEYKENILKKIIIKIKKILKIN